MILIFLGVVLLVIALIHYYLWRRLVHDTARPGRWRRAGTIAIVTSALWLVATLIGGQVLPHGVTVALAWPGYLWLALMFYLLVVLLVLELPSLGVKAWWRVRAAQATVDSALDPPEDEPETDESRRRLLARGVAVAAGLVAVGVTASGVRTALGPPRLNRVQIPVARLPRAADGLRVALVSDIHLGPLRGVSHSQRVVDMINGLDADLVAMVGDLVDGSVEELSGAVEPLRELRGRLGAYFVTGNHEYFSGADAWVAKVAELGLRPLRNEHVALPNGLDLIGVNDVTGSDFDDGPDFDKALVGRDPARPAVLLAHQPVQAAEAARRGIGLQLAGHTHGGQMYPFHLLVKLQQPVLTGLGEVDGMPVYVTNGAGFWGPPVRVGAPPDITLIELRSP